MSNIPGFWDAINDSIFVWTNLDELTFLGSLIYYYFLKSRQGCGDQILNVNITKKEAME